MQSNRPLWDGSYPLAWVLRTAVAALLTYGVYAWLLAIHDFRLVDLEIGIIFLVILVVGWWIPRKMTNYL